MIWMPFISFSCLIIVARTSSTVLNRSGRRRQRPLVLDDENKKAFQHFHLVLIIGCGLVTCGLYYVGIFLPHFLLSFLT